MLIVYASRTGNVKRFVDKLNMRSININDIDDINEPYVLITYTTGFGQVPVEVEKFLSKEENIINLCGVASSGNRNWGEAYGKSGDIISQQYNVPLVMKFEMSGTLSDIAKFNRIMEEMGI